MDADLILPPGADRQAWLDTRKTGVGSSDVSAVLDMSLYDDDPRSVWEQKTGRAGPKAETSAMFWGTECEPVVASVFSRRAQIGVEPTGTWRSRRWPWLIANPDRLTDDGGGLECKTAWTRNTAEQWDDQLPDHAELQAQHCMAVLGLPHWWVAGLVVGFGGPEFVWRRVLRDDELIEIIVERTKEFWSHVELDTPPPGGEPIDRFRRARPGTEVQLDLATASRLRTAYRIAAADQKADKQAFTAAQDALREVIGDAEAASCGDEVIATWDHTGKFDAAGFRAAHPDIAAEFIVTTEAIDTERLAAAHPELYRTHRGRVLRVKGA